MWNRIIDISSNAIKHWKSISLVYLTQLLLGIVVAVIAYNQFDGAIGNSLELDRLARGFDRSVFSDMVNNFTTIIGQIQSQFILIVLLFLLLSIFIHAGLLANIRNGEFAISSFFRYAKKYFVKFFGVVGISLVKMLFILAVIWVPFFKYLGNPLETFHSEKSFILTVVGLVMLSVLLVIIIWLWSVLSRYQIVDGDKFIVAMKSGWKRLKSNFLNYYSIGVGLILLHVLITWLYTFVVDDWGAESWLYLFSLIVIQQWFSILRIWIRVFGYAAVDNASNCARSKT